MLAKPVQKNVLIGTGSRIQLWNYGMKTIGCNGAYGFSTPDVYKSPVIVDNG